MVVAMVYGSISIPVGDVLNALLPGSGPLSDDQARNELVILHIRLPRVLMAALVGATLAVCGSAMQSLFRNALAEPGLIGVSAGCTLGAVSYIVLAGRLLPAAMLATAQLGMPVASFLGGLALSLWVFRFSLQQGKTRIERLLLAGIGINALAFAAIGLLVFVATDEQVRAFTFWTLGSLNGSTWHSLTVAATASALPLAILPASARQLNLMLLGEDAARSLGIPVRRLQMTILLLAALGVGAAISFCGTIGFIGLVAPHLARMTFGPDHRRNMLAAALLGALLLTAADTLSRTIAAPTEVPVGIITGALGASFLLWLLRKEGKQLTA